MSSTVELTKGEEGHVARMASSFREPTMEERSKSWMERAVLAQKQEDKKSEKQSGPREVKLAGRPQEEQDFYKSAGVRDDSERETFLRDGILPPAKETAKPEEKSQHDAAKNADEQKQGADDGSTKADSDAPPHYADKNWTPEGHHERKRNMMSAIQELPKAVLEKVIVPIGPGGIVHTKGGDLHAGEFIMGFIADTRNPAAVVKYIADYDISKTWQWRNESDLKKIMAQLHLIDQTVGSGGAGNGANNGARQGETRPKPRAPKPPQEIGGRGAATEDAAIAAARDGNFGAFDAEHKRRHFR
jgi:hypothetical protein